ncbi:MAG: AAA family ATPase [Deltaproteobacteria bacterium]|nr:AAA family ATPase [Deltaproteobacteria bacterium]
MKNLKPLAQEKAWAHLLKISGSLPQGLILIGPSGVGKRRTVKALFQYLHCEGVGERPCGECAGCRKVAEGRHADFIEIAATGEEIKVDDLREMKKALFFPPIDGAVRFVLLDEAHRLNAHSANALLKTLEEPPAHTRFFLVTHERGLLPPTILSRCQFVYFSPLDHETISALLEKLSIGIPAQLRTLCLDLMAGGMSRAEMFSDEKTLEFLAAVFDAVEKAGRAGAGAWESAVRLADSLGNDGAKIELFLDVLLRSRAQAAREALEPDRRSDAAYAACKEALETALLRRRLSSYANKKLIALAASSLAHSDAAGERG